jgi:hypothetical protein
MKPWRANPVEHLPAIVCAVALVCFGAAEAPATAFQNLGFESAVIGVPQNHQLPASQATPFWTNNLGDVWYDGVTLAGAAVSIQDSFSPVIKPLAGNYSVMLQDGVGPPNGQPYDLTSAYISQVGDVPSWAKSLMFKSDISVYINELRVSLNCNVIPFTHYAVGGTVNSGWGPVNTYACNISAFAGEPDVTLKFEKLVHDPLHPNSGIVDLDAITFSTIFVPEPSTIALLAMGIVSLAGYRWRRRNRLARRKGDKSH